MCGPPVLPHSLTAPLGAVTAAVLLRLTLSLACIAQTPGRKRFKESVSGQQEVAPVDTHSMDRARLVEEIRSLESDMAYMVDKGNKLEV